MANVIDRANSLMKRRMFSRAITMLEARSEFYADDFEYYVTLGKACLYVGDFGSAASYYSRAREIKINNSDLLLGQAAIFLTRGDTERAVDYYLNVLENDPRNVTAKAALDFIRTKGDYPTICRWNDSGKIKRFFPPLGINPLIVMRCALAGLAAGFLIAFFVMFFPQRIPDFNGPRANLSLLSAIEDSSLVLSKEEMAKTRISLVLQKDEIRSSMNRCVKAFNEYKDNTAQIEINRLLNSNAGLEVRQKISVISEKLNSNPGFDSLMASGDNIQFTEIDREKFYLYEDCVVSWRGTVANETLGEDGSSAYSFLVGYHDKKTMLAQVKIYFKNIIDLDYSKPVQFLAKLHFDTEGNLFLEGLGFYQPLEGVFKD
ncbi:MAG: hypothetical protein J5780_03165 [Treponema sp.]|nr:hypothetical protein [Treponema sp.]